MPRRGGRRERALLTECVLALGEERPGLTALAATADGPAFVALARACAVSGTAAHALLARGAADRFDPGAFARLREDYEAAAALNALHLREAQELQRALAARGIASLALKGVALLAAHYPALGARRIVDVDLLVHPVDLARAAAVLEDCGTVPACRELPMPDGRPVGPKVDGDVGHHLPARRTAAGVACELHWRAPGGEAEVGALFSRSREVLWHGRPLRIPAPEDLAGIACTHALVSHRHDLQSRLRLLADLALLAATGADLELAERIHGAAVAAGRGELAAARSDPWRAVPRLAGSPFAPLATRAATSWAAVRRARAMRTLGRLLFPSRRFLVARYGIRPSARWWPLLWIWRPMRAAVRLVLGS